MNRIWILIISVTAVLDFKVLGDCSGDVTSHNLSYGDSKVASVLRPSIISPVTCTWEIVSATNGLLLEFEDVDVPGSQLCEQGYLQITVGQYGRFDAVSMDRWCGQFYPRRVYVSGHITVRLHLQPSPHRAGIRFKYTSVFPSELCTSSAQNLTGSGYIYSPGYGGHWTVAPNLSCQWQIEADPGHVVQVELLNVDFSQWACSKEEAHLTAFDGVGGGDKLGSWCNTSTLAVTKSTGSSLLLHYVNAVPHRGSGFILKYYSVPNYDASCGTPIRDVTARRTPTFIKIHQGQKLCKWDITTENENELVVMETEYYDFGIRDCSTFELSYFDGQQQNSTTMQSSTCKGTGSPSHHVTQSSGRHALLVMKHQTTPLFGDPAIHALIRLYSVPNVPCWEEHSIYTADESISRVWLTISNTTQHSGCDIRIKASLPKHCIKVQVVGKHGATVSVHDVFHVYDGPNASSKHYESRCSSVRKSYTYSSATELFLVRRFSPHWFLDVDGFWLEYQSVTNCEIGDFIELDAERSNYQSITIPNYPRAQTNVSQLCQYVIGTQSSVSVIELSVTEHDSNTTSADKASCSQNVAVVSDDISGEAVIGWWCRGVSPRYTSNSNMLYITYMNSGNNISYHRPRPSLYYKTKPREICQKSLLAPEGSALEISSPYYPNFYPNQASCLWRITTGRVNYRVEMHVKDMSIDLGTHANCSTDYLAFYNGDEASALEITRLCGGMKYPQRSIHSSGQTINAQFHSDNTMAARGFKASYKAVKVFTCNETLVAQDKNARHRFISSPFFPNNYGRNLRCYWLLKTSEDRFIQTDMLLAEFPGSKSTCSGDHLTIYNGRDDTSPMLGQVCGHTVGRYRSSGSHMYIVFKSDDDHVIARGFQMQYYSEYLYPSCQGSNTLVLYGNKSTTGYLDSPFYPMGFPTGLSCRWKVKVSPGFMVELSVVQSDVISDCHAFQVRFYDGSTRSSKVLGHWCGEKGGVFTSTADTMYITLHSTHQTTAGFRLMYMATGAGVSYRNTALVIGAIVGSIFLLVLLTSISICCCCCSDRCSKGATPGEDTESEEDSASRKGILKSRQEKDVKGTNLRVDSLVPTAPPLELSTGIDNPAFDSAAMNTRTHTSIYPAFPSASDMQKTQVVIDNLMTREGLRGKSEMKPRDDYQNQSKKHMIGKGRGGYGMTADQNIRRAGDRREQIFQEKSDQVTNRAGMHNTSRHSLYSQFPSAHDIHISQAVMDDIMAREGLRAPTHRGPYQVTEGQMYREMPQSPTFVPVLHQHHVGNTARLEAVVESGALRQDKEQKRGYKKAKKSEKMSQKCQKRETVGSLKKTTSIECSEDDDFCSDVNPSLASVLQARHSEELKPLGHDHQLAYDNLTNIPFVLTQETPMHLPRDTMGNCQKKEPWADYPQYGIPCCYPDSYGDSYVPSGQVVHADIHDPSAINDQSYTTLYTRIWSPSNREVYQENCCYKKLPESNFVPRSMAGPEMTLSMFGIKSQPYEITTSDKNTTSSPIWSIGMAPDVPMLPGLSQMPPQVHELGPALWTLPEHHALFHLPSSPSDVRPVPLLLPIPEHGTTSNKNCNLEEDVEDIHLDIMISASSKDQHNHAGSIMCSEDSCISAASKVQDSANVDGTTDVHKCNDDPSISTSVSVQNPSEEDKDGASCLELQPEMHQTFSLKTTPIEDEDVGKGGALKMNEVAFPPDPSTLVSFRPPPHWMEDSTMTCSKVDKQPKQNVPNTSCQPKTPANLATYRPEQELGVPCTSKGMLNDDHTCQASAGIDVSNARQVKPDSPTGARVIKPDQDPAVIHMRAKHCAIPENARSTEVYQSTEVEGDTTTEARHNEVAGKNKVTEFTDGVTNEETMGPKEVTLQDNRDVEELQHMTTHGTYFENKFAILKLRGFTTEEVETMDETVV